MMLAGDNTAKHGLHLPPILNRSKANIRASVEIDEGPASERRAYKHSSRDERTSRSLNIDTNNSSSSKRSMLFNSDTVASIRPDSSNYRSSEGLVRLTTEVTAVPCAQTTAKFNRQQQQQPMPNGIQRLPLAIKQTISKLTSNDGDLQSTKRNFYSQAPPPLIPANHNSRTIDGRRPAADGAEQTTALTRELLRNLIATRKAEFMLRHPINSKDVDSGGIAESSKDQQSPGSRCYMRNNKVTTLQRIEPRLRPIAGGDLGDDPLLLHMRGQGAATDDRSRGALEGMTKQRLTTPFGNRSLPKRGSGVLQSLTDHRHQIHKQLSNGAILPPPRLGGQSGGKAGYAPTVAGSLRRCDAIAERSVPMLESRSPTEFISELVRCHKEATDRCLLGPSEEERERHRVKEQLKAAAATESGTQLKGGEVTDHASNIQADGIDENPAPGITGLESETGQEVVDGGGTVETGERIDAVVDDVKVEEDSVTASEKSFNPLENYGFELQHWAKARRESMAITNLELHKMIAPAVKP